MAGRRWMRTIVGGLAAIVLFAATAEIAVRLIRPAPRRQVVRETDGRRFARLDGTWVWRSWQGDEVRHDDCPAARPEARVVVFVGDSIFFPYRSRAGGPITAFSDLLQTHFDAHRDGICVLNLSEPAFGGRQQLAVLRDALARFEVDAVIWEIWKTDGRFVRVGDALYEVSIYNLDADGLPTLGRVPIPEAWSAALFRRSAAWRLLVLTLGPYVRRPKDDDDLWTAVWAAGAAAAEEGAAFVVALMPPLDQPFAVTVRTRREGWDAVEAWAADRDVTVVDVAKRLAGQDHEALREDACCHYNQAGHARLAELFAPVVREALGDVSSGAPPR